MNDLPCPKALLDIQAWFANIITAPLRELDQANLPIYKSRRLIAEIRQRIAPSPHLKSEERIGIYHQQYWWRLIEIMQELYPSLVSIFGYKDFNHELAEPYLLKFPPNDWFLSRIGANLPKWLKKHYREKDFPLVHGLSELDLAYESLIFTKLLPKIEPKTLPFCETETLYLQPFVRLFEFDVDFFTFRAQLLEHPPAHWETHDLPQIKKELKRAYFVLYRKNEKNFYEKISQSQHTLLKRFQKGAKLVDLIPLLSDCNEIVDWFQKISSRNWLSFVGCCEDMEESYV